MDAKINFKLYQPKPVAQPAAVAMYTIEHAGWRVMLSYSTAAGASHKPYLLLQPAVPTLGEYTAAHINNVEKFLPLFGEEFRAWLIEFIREAETQETARRLALDAPVDATVESPESPQ